MFNLGFQELLIFGIIAVLLFGKRLPEVARSLGQSYHEFRRGLHDLKSEVDDAVYTARSEVRSIPPRYLTQQNELQNPTAPVLKLPEQKQESPGD
jgi:sec-independent protein translocase protein TatA